jgi:hypothetical protein
MMVPSNEVMFQSVGTPETGVAWGVTTRGWHDVVDTDTAAAVVVVDDAEDEQPVSDPATTTARSPAQATARLWTAGGRG